MTPSVVTSTNVSVNFCNFTLLFQSPMFIVHVVLEPEELKLDPSFEVAKYMFNHMFGIWEDNSKAIKSLVADSFYASFTT